MKFKEIKELVIKDLAITAMGFLAFAINVIEKVGKQETKEIRFFKVKTKNYHVRLLVDQSIADPLILVRPRGFLKDWTCMDRRDIPKCIPQDIFEDSCTQEKRRSLVNKIVELKAFW
jgi:hypothetical protein